MFIKNTYILIKKFYFIINKELSWVNIYKIGSSLKKFYSPSPPIVNCYNNLLHLTPHAQPDLPTTFTSFPFVVANERETVSTGEQLGHERERRKAPQKKENCRLFARTCGWWKRRCLGKRHCCVTAERRRSASSVFILLSAVPLWSRPTLPTESRYLTTRVLIVVIISILAVAKLQYYVFSLSYLKIVSSSVR